MALRLLQNEVVRKIIAHHYKSFSLAYVRKLVPRSDQKKKKVFMACDRIEEKACPDRASTWGVHVLRSPNFFLGGGEWKQIET